jgi:ABC-type uncharacterized transport system ATPase subunit
LNPSLFLHEGVPGYLELETAREDYVAEFEFLLDFSQQEVEEILAITRNSIGEDHVAVGLYHVGNQTTEILLNFLLAQALQIILRQLAKHIQTFFLSLPYRRCVR